jgi:Tfp pilus assembly protein PilF
LTKPTFDPPGWKSRLCERSKGLWLIIASVAVGLPLVVGAVAAKVGRQHLQRPLKATPALSTLFDAGLSQFRAGRTAAALIDWRRALVLSPNDAAVHNNIGSAFMRLGQPSEARSSFQKAVELDPKQELFSKNLDWATRELARPRAEPVTTPRTH